MCIKLFKRQKQTNEKTMSDNKGKIVELSVEELSQPTGNLAFQNDEDYVRHIFIDNDGVKIKGESHVFNKNEVSDLLKRIKELKNEKNAFC